MSRTCGASTEPPLQNDGYTNDTSDTSVTGGGDGDSELHAQLGAQKVDYEARLAAMQDSEDADDLKVEKEHMEAQLKLVQSQMKRLLGVRARGAAAGLLNRNTCESPRPGG